MKKLGILAGAFVLVFVAYAIVHAAVATYQRYTVAGTQIWLLQNDGTQTQTGSLKFGSDATTPALPTTSNGAQFGVKIPVYNVGATATVQGTLLCSSNTGTGYVAACVTSNNVAVIGVADGAIASGGLGYASVAGYALVLSSYTVAIGDVLVSTVGVAGYAATNNTPTSGTNVGVAESALAAGGGGLVLVRLR